jgi:acylphosphatase
VHGNVQGVNYRWLVQEAAKSLGIRGWVRNLDGGNVEILCESDTEKAYREFLKRIEIKDGMRRVEKIETLEFSKNAEPEFKYFAIDY